MKFDRNTHAVVGANAVFARQHKERSGVDALLQQFGKRVAYPLDARGFGLVLKGNDQEGLTGCGWSLGKGNCGQEQHCAELEKFQGK